MHSGLDVRMFPEDAFDGFFIGNVSVIKDAPVGEFLPAGDQ